MSRSHALCRPSAWLVATALLLASSCARPAPGTTAPAAPAATTSASAELVTPAAPAGARPNIVMIFTDDQRYDTMGCTGHPFIATPNLDRLAAEGALFEKAFVITSLCCPSRATVLSGLYTHLTGVTYNDHDLDYDQVPYLPRLLKQAGYATGFIGKYHMGGARNHPRPGFDHWAAYRGQGRYFDATLNINGEDVPTRGFSTDVVARMAVDWIVESGRPMFLILSLKNPHPRFLPPRRHLDLYADVSLQVPASFTERTSLGESTNLSADEVVERMLGYSRMIPSIDDTAATVYDALARAGILDETALVLFSDNGYLLGEHGKMEKGSAYEVSMRVPFILRYPPLARPGTRVNRQVLNLDLAPTVLALAGVPAPERMSGASVLPLLAGDVHGWRDDWLYLNYYRRGTRPNQMAVRGERWKYISTPRTELLFDLESDPEERHDLATDPAHADLLSAQRLRLGELMAQEQVPTEWRPRR